MRKLINIREKNSQLIIRNFSSLFGTLIEHYKEKEKKFHKPRNQLESNIYSFLLIIQLKQSLIKQKSMIFLIFNR